MSVNARRTPILFGLSDTRGRVLFSLVVQRIGMVRSLTEMVVVVVVVAVVAIAIVIVVVIVVVMMVEGESRDTLVRLCCQMQR